MANITAGSIVWNLDIEDGGFQNKLSNAKNQVNKLGNDTEKSFSSLGSTISSAFSNITSSVGAGLTTIGQLAVSKVGLIGGGGLIAFATAAAFSASKIDELTLAMHAVAKANGVTQSAVDSAVVGIRKQNISYVDAIKATSNFVTANIKLSDSIKLATAAKDLAIGTDYGSSDALSTLTQAIVTNQTQTLANFGILTTQTQAYGDYAKTIGKSATELTQQEKQQALLNVVLEAGTKRVGAYDAAQQSAAKQFRSLTTRIIPDFIAQIGKAFEPSLAIVVQSITKAIQGMGTWLTNNQQIVDTWGKKLADVTKIVVDAFGSIFNFLINNQGVIIGVLAAVALGIGAVAIAFTIANLPAIAILAVFAALGYIIPPIIAYFGGLSNIIATLQPVLDVLSSLFRDFIIPQFTTIWSVISTQLIPALTDLWNVISPVLIPVLQFLGAVIGLAVVGAVILFIEIIKFAVISITNWVVSVDTAIKNVIGFFTSLLTGIQNIWTSITTELAKWVSDIYDWGVNLIKSFADGIKSAGKYVVSAVENALNSAKNLLKGNSPPVEGPYKDIDKWGFNVGNAWVQGVRNAIGGLTLDTPMMSLSPGYSTPALASSQQKSSGSGALVNVEQMNVRQDSDINDVARELGFRIETSTGFTNG